MAFFYQMHRLIPLEKGQLFLLFDLLLFKALKGVFSFQNIVKDIFFAHIALKKVLKMAIFAPKPLVNPLGKMLIFFTFWTFCFYSLEWRFFVLEYHKRHFPGLCCLNKKVGKMPIFGPKPWVNPLKKMSIFRLFGLLVLIAQKGVFSLQNIIKDIFLAYIA